MALLKVIVGSEKLRPGGRGGENGVCRVYGVSLDAIRRAIQLSPLLLPYKSGENLTWKNA